MKFSELNTDRALDVMCELTPYIGNISSDKSVVETIGKVSNDDAESPVNKYGHFAHVVGWFSECLPLLLKTHRADVYGILSVMNERPVSEIAAQKFVETVRQVKELFTDEEFVSFFRSSAQQAQSEQPAPSAAYHA